MGRGIVSVAETSFGTRFTPTSERRAQDLVDGGTTLTFYLITDPSRIHSNITSFEQESFGLNCSHLFDFPFNVFCLNLIK